MPNPKEEKLEKRSTPNRLPGSGVRRDLKETWGTILSKTQQGVERNNSEAKIVSLERISPNPDQPRRVFNPENDQELADDIAARGVLEPIIVRPTGEDDAGLVYQIIAGERRYRAAKHAGLTEIPVIIKEYNDKQARLASLVENLQRENLHPEDEARYFMLLIEQFNLSYKEIAGLVHRSASYVAGRIKLLNDPKIALELEEATTEEQLERDELENATRETSTNRKRNSVPSGSFATRPIVRFRTYLLRTKFQVPELNLQDRQTLAEQIKEIRQQLDELEQEVEKITSVEEE